jgi:hypothetical protein
MKNFEFKSQICTTKEQSERLLACGLKKETADMRWERISEKYVYYPSTQTPYTSSDIPAWSLHRLMEIMYNGDLFGFVSLTTHNRNIDTIYELVIANIEGLIKIDKFNKDYLEEKK